MEGTRPISILIVEDQQDHLNLYSSFCQSMKSFLPTLYTAVSLSKARELLSQTRVDVILLDLGLPDSQGLESLLQIQNIHPSLPIVILTGQHARDLGREAIQMGAQDYLVKGEFTAPLLERAILYGLERKKLQKKLQEQFKRASQEWQDTVDAIPDAIFILDTSFQILKANRTADLLFGFSPGKMVGKKCYEMIHKLDHPWPHCPWAKACQSGKISREEVDDPAIGIPLEMLVVPIKDQEGKVIKCVHIARDLREKKKAEKELLQSQKMLLHSQKMDAIGRLAGGVAHDFNNLLTVMIGLAELNLNNPHSSPGLQKDLREIHRCAKDSARLTDQLLSLSRKKILQPTSLQLNDLIGDMTKMLKRIIGEDVELITQLAPNLPWVRADPGQIKQILLNLSINGRQAMTKGGTLTISTKLADSASSLLVDFRPQDGPFVCFKVEDTGNGIDPEILPHIFEPFFTTKEESKGTGLGLAVVYGIVKQHKGSLQVTSQKGEGTSFQVYLPLQEEQKENLPGKLEFLPLHSRRGERILVVEDDPSVSNFVMTLLLERGYKPFLAQKAHKALEMIQQANPPFDLIFVDMVLPDKTGLWLRKQILASQIEVPILFCSGYPDQRAELAFLEEQGLPFLPKPYTLENFFTQIEGLLG